MLSQMPVVLYGSGTAATADLESLQRLAEVAVIKSVFTPDELLRETTLFLHQANYLGRVEVNEKTCVGCKLCEEVCGWEGIYIMPGKEKEAFLTSLGYEVKPDQDDVDAA